ncbi:PAS domain S-box protein [Halovenus sp. HT40]|uniref:PAS domain S-box protein n=1 Tax=Halovenus sp. HT40 TaxID=3126691 RepID=UPI00300F527E
MIQQGYVFVFILTGVICLLGGASVRNLSYPAVRRSLVGLLAFNGIWSLLVAAQLVTTAPSIVRAIHIAALIFGIATVFVWLAFASAYSGREYHRHRSLRTAALVVFLGIVTVKLTNPIHGFYFSTSAVSEPFVHTAITYHSPHWFVTGFSYTTASVGFLWLFESFNRRGDESLRPTLLYALVFATALPIIPYGLSSYADFLIRTNYEPLGVAVFALGVSSYARTEFTHHSSPGQSTLVDSLSDAGLLLDDSGVVLNHNERAEEILDRPHIPRVPLEQIDPELAALEPGETTRFTYDLSGQSRVYEASRSSVEDSLIASEIISLKNVTRVTRLEQLTSIHQELGDALVNATDPDKLVQTIPRQFAEIDAYELVWLSPASEQDETALSSDRNPSSRATDAPGAVVCGPSAYTDWTTSNAAPTEPVLRAARDRETTRADIESSTAEWSDRLGDHGVTDSLAVPFSATDDQSYVLGIYTTAADGFDAAERQLIEEICRRIPETIQRMAAHREALQYKEAITHAGTAVFITDPDGTIQYVNPAFERLTGYSAAEAVGETPHILTSGEMSDEHYDKLWETITAGNVFEERIVNKTKSGDRYIAEQTISPVLNDGEPVAFVAIQFEVTDKILREQRLSVLRRVLRHNLRTELNVIDGHATLLEDRLTDRLGSGTLPDDVSESIETIRTHAAELASQSDTAREIEQALSRDETGRVRVSTTELAKTAEETAEFLGGTCAVSVAEDVTQWQVDVELTRVVKELIENAIVHSECDPSTVDVQFSLERQDSDLVLTVEDDGPGMSEQELIFVEEGEEDPLRHGSGLDLWLVYWLTVSVGGSISASTGDEGTIIRVTVPLRAGSDADSRAQSAVSD